MKPFNLEEAKAGKPIVTRDGREAKFIAHVPQAVANARVVVTVQGDEGTKICLFTELGRYYCSPHSNTNLDLFMAATKREAWINFYGVGVHCWVYPTKESAEQNAGKGRITCQRIEWEE